MVRRSRMPRIYGQSSAGYLTRHSVTPFTRVWREPGKPGRARLCRRDHRRCEGAADNCRVRDRDRQHGCSDMHAHARHALTCSRSVAGRCWPCGRRPAVATPPSGADLARAISGARDMNPRGDASNEQDHGRCRTVPFRWRRLGLVVMPPCCRSPSRSLTPPVSRFRRQQPGSSAHRPSRGAA